MIKVLVPDMPSASRLLPYLNRIDSSRVYVNNGPLVQELEMRLSTITGTSVVTVANGTMALELAIKAACPCMTDPYAILMPAVTFSATGLAALKARFDVELSDVSPSTWQLTREIYNQHDDSWIRGVMPVAAFGHPVKPFQWRDMEVPVIIDSAGAFPTEKHASDRNIISCYSLHATKFIGAGEGGFVASANAEWIDTIRSMAAFGTDGCNAKMSEYHAAVALASLDYMAAKSSRTLRVINWYVQHGVCQYNTGGLLRATNTLLPVCLPVPAQPVAEELLKAGIETKQWYRPYLDEREEFGCGKKLPVTERLRTHLLGLPFHNFLTERDVEHVCSTLRKVLI